MKKTDNQALVIFGASGDLTERKLIPSVFNLFCGGFLPESYAVVGVSRSVYTDEEYRQKVVFENEHLKNKKAATPEKLKAFAELVFYQSVNTKEISAYSALKERLDQLDKQKSCANNYIFYLATPPSLYQTIAKGLADSGLNNQENGWSRLIVEKPFGYDLDSAKKLNKDLLSNFVEEQILVTENFSFSIEQTSFVVKDSVTDSIEKINFWITSRFSTINKENLSVSNEVMEIILHNKIKMLYFMEILLQEIMQRPSKKSVAFYFL